jgi:RNA polymerase sigma factor (sigma-70 family)
LIQGFHLARPCRALHLERIAVVQVILLQCHQNEKINGHPDGAAPVGVAAEQVCPRLAWPVIRDSARQPARHKARETRPTCLAQPEQVSGRRTFLTWLTRIVINESLITIRCRKRKRELDAGESSEAALAEAVDSTPTPEKRCENREVQIAIHQAISSLHSKLRKVVLLRELNGCTKRETAKELGITISAAKARIHRARHDMRVQIEPRHSAAHAAFLYR